MGHRCHLCCLALPHLVLLTVGDALALNQEGARGSRVWQRGDGSGVVHEPPSRQLDWSSPGREGDE